MKEASYFCTLFKTHCMHILYRSVFQLPQRYFFFTHFPAICNQALVHNSLLKLLPAVCLWTWIIKCLNVSSLNYYRTCCSTAVHTVVEDNFIILILVAHYKFKCPFVVGVLVALMEALEVYSKRSNMEKSPLFKSPMLRWLLSLLEW